MDGALRGTERRGASRALHPMACATLLAACIALTGAPAAADPQRVGVAFLAGEKAMLVIDGKNQGVATPWRTLRLRKDHISSFLLRRRLIVE